MSRAARELRNALDAFYSGEQGLLLARMRDPSVAQVPATRALAAKLCGSYGADLCAEVRERGEDAPSEVEWLTRHVARLPYTLAVLDAERAVAEARSALLALNGAPLSLREQLARIARAADARHRNEAARELDSALRQHATARAAHTLRCERLLFVDTPREQQQAAAPARPTSSGLLIVSAFDPSALSEPSRDLPDAPWHEHARAFLGQTEDAAEDAVGFLMRSVAKGEARDLPGLAYALRAAELDSDIGRKQRWSRASAWLAALGFTPDLQARVRTEVDGDAFDPRARVVLRHVPRDVRLAQGASDFGALSDVFAAEGVARALGFALVHAALPSELRWPLGASSTGTLATLGALVWADRTHLERIQHLPRTPTERIARLCGTFTLLHLRATIALALLPGGDGEPPDARLDAACEALSHALRVRVSPGLTSVWLEDRVRLRERALEQLSGVAAAVALRERFDVDWFRNPRSAALLRGMVQRGNAVGPLELCEEHGVGLAAAAARACELVA